MSKVIDPYKYSNPEKVQEKAIAYLGKDVIIDVSTKKNKKYMIFNPNTKKWVHFGQYPYEDFTKHLDEKRRKNYLTRTAGIKGDWKNDKYSANNLSREYSLVEY
jgi:phosphoribosylformimino-5-aminoimidazole carboxamide ribonucleotide (ProFAR) isomerase